jgi:hypothetical protein
MVSIGAKTYTQYCFYGSPFGHLLGDTATCPFTKGLWLTGQTISIVLVFDGICIIYLISLLDKPSLLFYSLFTNDVYNLRNHWHPSFISNSALYYVYMWVYSEFSCALRISVASGNIHISGLSRYTIKLQWYSVHSSLYSAEIVENICIHIRIFWIACSYYQTEKSYIISFSINRQTWHVTSITISRYSTGKRTPDRAKGSPDATFRNCRWPWATYTMETWFSLPRALGECLVTCGSGSISPRPLC